MMIIFAMMPQLTMEAPVLPEPSPVRAAALAAEENATAPEPHEASVLYPDPTSQEYKRALSDVLRTQRDERYAHLNDAQFDMLTDFVEQFSDTIAIEGVAPSTVHDYLFDIELKPGTIPSRAQLPKMSPAEMEKERYHLEKEEK